jgi:Fe-S cluster assembly iron-binding protein IscA
LSSPETMEPVEGDSAPVDSPAGVILTAAAVEKVSVLLGREGRDDLRLRVAVQPGGCSGLRYQLFFDDRLFDTDQVTRFGDAENPVSERDSGHDSDYERGPAGNRQPVSGVGRAPGLASKPAGFEVVVDNNSLLYLNRATIHFTDNGIQEQGFVIDNPNAQGSCACGDSFH